jgi:hypothetical protein
MPDYKLWVTLHGGNGRWQQALLLLLWRCRLSPRWFLFNFQPCATLLGQGSESVGLDACGS